MPQIIRLFKRKGTRGVGNKKNALKFWLEKQKGRYFLEIERIIFKIS